MTQGEHLFGRGAHTRNSFGLLGDGGNDRMRVSGEIGYRRDPIPRHKPKHIFIRA